VLIFSRVRRGDQLEPRFIASAIGDGFAFDRRLYTGRQWWGSLEGGRIGPVVGPRAGRIGSSLGVDMTRPGTSLLILDPDLRGRTPHQAMEFLTSSLVWHAWPKMVPPPSRREPAVRTFARLEGEDFPIRDPKTQPRLRPFIEALQHVRAEQSGVEYSGDGPLPTKVLRIRCGSPKRQLGHLGFAFASTGSDAGGGASEEEESNDECRTDAAPFSGHSRHTAVMRQAELIVTYEEGPPSCIEGFQWAGAFRTLEAVDAHFAAAEPPAHEGWDPEFVADRHGRTFVRVALRRIRDAMRAFAAPRRRTIRLQARFPPGGLETCSQGSSRRWRGTAHVPARQRRDLGRVMGRENPALMLRF
jgi:hypothetical protein